MNNELNGINLKKLDQIPDEDNSSDSEANGDDFSQTTDHRWASEHTEAANRLAVSTSFGQESRASSVQSYDAGLDVDIPVVSADNERQILLLMLLAQVCALHDPTPRTFTVHVLELYERGILDRECIGFLFDLGLVPGTNPSNPLFGNDEARERAIQVRHSLDPYLLRSQEASAIRSHLQRHESFQEPNDARTSSCHHLESDSEYSSWNVDEHPLSLSRYFREFHQVKLLNSGSFGSVYHASHKMDGRDYAVKRVVFSESGYANDTVTQVVREVRCLAQCDHPNVVRYYTSWLEPSWVTGSGTAVSSADQVASQQVQRRLLTDIHRFINDSLGDSRASQDEGSERSSCFEDTIDSFASEWSNGNAEGLQLQEWMKLDTLNKEQGRSSYRYQLCFFIQMQLCKPKTLADCIRDWNNEDRSELDGYESAVDIFVQLAKGLAHIHEAGILHRDVKPSNCLVGEDGQFKIGDFGLSTLLRQASGCDAPAPDVLVVAPDVSKTTSDWKDPLTMGVGTASYCAPEQASTNTYGPSADVFSLGLILLELFCSFGTEHERIHTFHDCRRGVLPERLKQTYPHVAETILSCTHEQPSMRPTAKDLVDSPLLFSRSEDHQGLRRKLLEQEVKIRKQRAALFEKDRVIEQLYREMNELKQLSSANGCAQAQREQEMSGTVETDFLNVSHGIVDSPSLNEGDY